MTEPPSAKLPSWRSHSGHALLLIVGIAVGLVLVQLGKQVRPVQRQLARATQPSDPVTRPTVYRTLGECVDAGILIKTSTEGRAEYRLSLNSRFVQEG